MTCDNFSENFPSEAFKLRRRDNLMFQALP